MKKLLSLVLALALCLCAVSALADTFGLGIVTSINSSKDAEIVDGDPYDGNAQVDSTICAVILDDDGVIVDIKYDVAQTKIPFSPEGLITADKGAEIKSKLELGEEYGMRGASPIGAELFEQIASFEEYCIGKSADEIISMPTYAPNENHPRVSDVADLKSSVTIDVGAMLDALQKAVNNAE
ncbi:hypothetical protein LJC74_09240 [Eubacteriales bacterium OttesenSCG-928-A19]|nr:hypothetical protein [Eubacteriales bacterium OttesenSCG-928-A19]